MSLCRYLPLPSDRMGIIWSLLSIKDSVVLEYGPAGTTHYSMGLYGGLGIDFRQRFFTTHMNEDDVVMGDVSRLEKALVEIDSYYHPQTIFVVASSVVAVIGTDIKGVCRYMQQEVQAKLIAFEQGGFRGDYAVGLEETYKLLANSLVEKTADKEPDTYNIIGASLGSYRGISDINEIKALLTEAFNIKLTACLCHDTSVAALKKAGTAMVNIILRQEGKPAGKILKEKCGTPYVLGAPYGYQGTLQWLQQISDILGKEINPVVLERLRGKINALMPMGPMLRRKAKPEAVIYGEYDLVVGYSKILEDQGFTVKAKLSRHSLKNILQPAEGVEHYSAEKQRLDLMKNLQQTLVLADDSSLRLCAASNTKLRITNPLLYGAAIANHLPFVGEKGADYLQETIETYLQTLY